MAICQAWASHDAAGQELEFPRLPLKKPSVLPPPLKINNRDLQQVEVMRILGVFLQSNLKWNAHVDYICTKSSQRLFFLRRLKHFHLDIEDLVSVYTTYIRPITEYATPVWHSGLTTSQSDRIERIQRRAVRIILGPDYSNYAEACSQLGLSTLHERREELTLKFARSLLTSGYSRDGLYANPATFSLSPRFTKLMKYEGLVTWPDISLNKSLARCQSIVTSGARSRPIYPLDSRHLLFPEPQWIKGYLRLLSKLG
ncbi:hypothetical protein Bbelb_126960 [Branchiostoma belcheri]|nr:hypothetical protein Bbelb_126960 [Branchiostoma belcheri]